MKYRFIIILTVFLLSAGGFAQTDLLKPLTDKAVIGFPEITQEQLDNIKVELLKNPRIETAYFVFGDHYCLMLTLDTSGNTRSFYDLLKPLNEIYEATSRCYIKPYEVYDFIVLKAGNTPTFSIKP